MANPRDTKRPDSEAETRSVTGDLASRIQRAQSERAAPAARGDGQQGGMQGANRGFRLASEFVAAIIVGGALGYGADLLFGTRPWAHARGVDAFAR